MPDTNLLIPFDLSWENDVPKLDEKYRWDENYTDMVT
jgi:hypothetical protein